MTPITRIACLLLLTVSIIALVLWTTPKIDGKERLLDAPPASPPHRNLPFVLAPDKYEELMRLEASPPQTCGNGINIPFWRPLWWCE